MIGSAGRYPTSRPFRSRLGPTEVAAATTTLDPVVDFVLLELLEQDWSIACEFRPSGSPPECGARASWWIICRECGHAIAECEPHRMQQSEELASPIAALFITVVCDRCDAFIAASRWRDLFIVEPIGVRS